MTRAIALPLFLFLLFPQSDSDLIIWKEGYALSWENFQAKPVKNSLFAASSNTGLNFGYSYSITDNQVDVEYTADSFFNPKKSWFLPEEATEHILSHEQTHFDISELHARILRKRMEQKKFTKKIKSEIEVIYLQVEEQRKAMQLRFDEETDHSRNHKRELFWKEYIAKQLAKYDAWK